MSDIDNILVFSRGLVAHFSVLFFFVLAFKYWIKAKSTTGVLLAVGLVMNLPMSMLLILLFGSALLNVLHLSSSGTTILPAYWKYLEMIATLGYFVLIIAFWVGIRNIHLCKKAKDNV